MILEALEFAASWALTPRRIAAEIRASVSLKARAGRCRRAWREHEAMSKSAILSAARSLKQRRTAVILGSGLLRDIPLAELMDLFDHVVLVDRQHLASVRLGVALSGGRRVLMLTRDVSGLPEIEAGIAAPRPLAFIEAIGDVDLVVSANLLSQLAVGVRHALRGLPPDVIERTARAVIAAHLDGLSTCEAAALLVTDTRYTIRHRSGTVLEETDLLFGLEPAADADWTWPVAPFGEIDRDHEAIHRVIASRLDNR